MLHILLTILKIIGIILACIPGLLLVVLLAVLFVPVRYRISGVKTEAVLDGKARISWLFGAVGINLFLKNKDFGYEIKILGIPFSWIQSFIKKVAGLFPGKDKKTAKNQKRTQCKEASGQKKKIDMKDEFKKETGQPEKKTCRDNKENITSQVEEQRKEESTEMKSFVGNIVDLVSGTFKKVVSVIKGIVSFPGRVMKSIKNIRLTICSICDKIKYWINFLQEEPAKEAISLVKREFGKVLKHILPRKISGNVTFGFEDPSKTGQLLAGISVFYPLYYKQINISPDFTQNILLGDVNIKGRIYLCVLVKTAVLVYFDKNIQYMKKKITAKTK